ncbi:MAG TPA: glycosyltransferase, partial [Planctomycetota bacterium]|nr:glycosyltransferase [Planctomycetota bacterium]
GNPVRPSVIVAREERRSRRRDPSLRRIVVVGGSQGARGLNEAIRRALPSLVAYRDRIEWLHVAGEADREAIASAYLEHGFSARVESFVPDLPRSFATADLAISRAGGTTLAELTAVGLPAVLVPYPHHRDRHQFKNAEALEEAGAAVVVPEERLDGARLRALFDDVLFDEERLESMERESRRIGRPDAAERVLELLTELRGRCP